MKSISGKDLAQILERNGWELLCAQGSHHIYGKSGMEARVSVPIHGGVDLKKGLLHHLLHIAGLSGGPVMEFSILNVQRFPVLESVV